MMLGPATAPDEAQGAPHRRVEDCSWLDDDASLGARRDHLIGLDAAGKRQRAVDERRLDHAVAEQRGARRSRMAEDATRWSVRLSALRMRLSLG